MILNFLHLKKSYNPRSKPIIRSIIIGRNIPNLAIVKYIDKNGVAVLQVIDGKQRLRTLQSFMKNEFEVDGYLYKDFNGGKEFNLLLNITAKIYYSHYDDLITDEQKIQLFKIINFAGTPQDEEHLDILK